MLLIARNALAGRPPRDELPSTEKELLGDGEPLPCDPELGPLSTAVDAPPPEVPPDELDPGEAPPPEARPAPTALPKPNRGAIIGGNGFGARLSSVSWAAGPAASGAFLAGSVGFALPPPGADAGTRRSALVFVVSRLQDNVLCDGPVSGRANDEASRSGYDLMNKSAPSMPASEAIDVGPVRSSSASKSSRLRRGLTPSYVHTWTGHNRRLATTDMKRFLGPSGSFAHASLDAPCWKCPIRGGQVNGIETPVSEPADNKLDFSNRK